MGIVYVLTAVVGAYISASQHTATLLELGYYWMMTVIVLLMGIREFVPAWRRPLNALLYVGAFLAIAYVGYIAVQEVRVFRGFRG